MLALVLARRREGVCSRFVAWGVVAWGFVALGCVEFEQNVLVKAEIEVSLRKELTVATIYGSFHRRMSLNGTHDLFVVRLQNPGSPMQG